VLLRYAAYVPIVFKSVSKRFDESTISGTSLFLITPDQCLPIGSVNLQQLACPYFFYEGGVIEHPVGSLAYDYEAEGLCGALVVNEQGKVFGFHVARNKMGKGIARPFKRNVRLMLQSCNNDGVGRILSPASAFVMPSDSYRHVPTNTTIARSELYGVFPVTREPAVLAGVNHEGKDILKVAVAKNLNPVGYVDVNCRGFITKVLQRVLGYKKFDSISEFEVVMGREGAFPGFDKTSSAGIPYGAKNSEVLDYDNGLYGKARVYVELMKEEFRVYGREGVAKNGKTTTSLPIVFGDTVKDELRPSAKKYKPRLFAAGPVHFALELKRLFCNMCEYVKEHRMENGIMVGINALGKEWDVFARRMTRLGWRIIPGDYESWDGKMHTFFQELLNDVLSKSCSNEVDYAKFLLDNLSHTFRAVKSDIILTNHSIPSGHFLTAIYNSLINITYVAYAYYCLCPESYCSKKDINKMVEKFFEDIYAAKYGDDLLINVSEGASSFFNAISYTKVMESLGIGFTSEKKTPHEREFYTLDECTFLKRGFVFHPRLGRMVGPLDVETITTTLSWVSDPTRMSELVDQKVMMFQREAFLHINYHELLNQVVSKYEEVHGFSPILLSDEELLYLYESDHIFSPYGFSTAQMWRKGCFKPKSYTTVQGVSKAGIALILIDEHIQKHVLMVLGVDGTDDKGKVVPGKYGIPKGNIEAGENSIAAGLREFYEETGITLSRGMITRSVDCGPARIHVVEVNIRFFSELMTTFVLDKKECVDYDIVPLARVLDANYNMVTRRFFENYH